MMMGKCTGYCRKVAEEVKSLTFWRDVLAEFIGTFFLTSVQCALPLTWSSLSPGSDHPKNPGGSVQTALGKYLLYLLIIIITPAQQSEF